MEEVNLPIFPAPNAAAWVVWSINTATSKRDTLDIEKVMLLARFDGWNQ